MIDLIYIIIFIIMLLIIQHDYFHNINIYLYILGYVITKFQ